MSFILYPIKACCISIEIPVVTCILSINTGVTGYMFNELERNKNIKPEEVGKCHLYYSIVCFW